MHFQFFDIYYNILCNLLFTFYQIFKEYEFEFWFICNHFTFSFRLVNIYVALVLWVGDNCGLNLCLYNGIQKNTNPTWHMKYKEACSLFGVFFLIECLNTVAAVFIFLYCWTFHEGLVWDRSLSIFYRVTVDIFWIIVSA